MARTLQEILNLAAEAETPEARADVIKSALLEGGATHDYVASILNEAVEQFGNLNAEEPTDEDGLLGLELLADVATCARAAQTDLELQEQEVKAQREKLAAKVAGEPDDAETDGDADGEAPEGETPEGVEAADTAEAGVEAADTAEAGAEGAAGGVEAAAAPEPVAASAQKRRFDLASIRGKAPAPKATEDSKPKLAITAAADVRGYAAGQDLDGMDGLVAAAIAKIEAMPRGVEGVHVRASYAQIRVPYPEDLVAGGQSAEDDEKVLARAADVKRLGDGSGLVAAGGWCAPSETFYELAPLLADPNAGLVDLPDIAVKRGGIRTTEGADFSQIYAGNVGLIQTEAQAEAGTEKVLFRVPCTSFTEVRADVIYTGIEAGILQDHAYPELTKQYVEGALTAHAHKINQSSIARMVSLSGTAVDLTTKLGPSAVGSVTNAIGLIIKDAQYRYRAPESMTFELVLPMWLKEVLRADMSLRESDGQLVQVTDQQISAWFAVRNARPQWVYDWQDAYSGVTGGFGSDAAITQYPDTVNALIYPAGTFVRGRGNVVNLDTVYDSQNIKQNDFLQLFTEEKLLVHRRQYRSTNVKIALGVRGATAIGQVLANGGTVPTTP